MLYKFYLLLVLCVGFLVGQTNNEYKIIASSNSFTYSHHKENIYSFQKGEWHLLEPFSSELNILSACVGASGELWILMPQKLAHFSMKNENWEFVNLPVNMGSISPSMFMVVGIEYWQDKIWIAAPEYLMSYDGNWQNHQYPIGVSGGKLQKGLDARLWLNGICNYNGKEWQILPIIPDFDFGDEEKYIFTLDGQARPWVIKRNKVYFFDLLQHKWIIVGNEFMFSRPTAIASFENEIWLCDYGRGVFRFVANEWRRSEHKKARPSLEYTYELFSSGNYLWINTYFGVGSFDGKEWISHFDYTKHDSIRTLFFSTLATIIMLLFASILLIFIANRIKNNLLQKKLSKQEGS